MNKNISKVFALVLSFMILFANFNQSFASEGQDVEPLVLNTLSNSRGISIENESYTEVDGERRFYFKGTGEIWGLKLINEDSEIISIDIYDENGNRVSTRSSDGNVAGAILEKDANYYIAVEPSGDYALTATKIKKVKAGEEVDQEWFKEELNDIAEMQEADFFEKVISFFVILMGLGLNGLISVIAGENLTLDAILFNRYKNTSLSFFKYEKIAMAQNPLLGSGTKEAINFLFGAFRTIAVAAYMAILVYMGIRILLISTADKKAKYKQLLFDWIKGIAILFLFPYVIKYTILLNHAFVEYIATKSNVDTGTSAMIQSVPGGISAASQVPVGRGQER